MYLGATYEQFMGYALPIPHSKYYMNMWYYISPRIGNKAEGRKF